MSRSDGTWAGSAQRDLSSWSVSASVGVLAAVVIIRDRCRRSVIATTVGEHWPEKLGTVGRVKSLREVSGVRSACCAFQRVGMAFLFGSCAFSALVGNGVIGVVWVACLGVVVQRCRRLRLIRRSCAMLFACLCIGVRGEVGETAFVFGVVVGVVVVFGVVGAVAVVGGVGVGVCATTVLRWKRDLANFRSCCMRCVRCWLGVAKVVVDVFVVFGWWGVLFLLFVGVVVSGDNVVCVVVVIVVVVGHGFVVLYEVMGDDEKKASVVACLSR